ncbi:MAG: hypothetical protein ACLP5H_34220 [Desulfomonilaceae bacterium]
MKGFDEGTRGVNPFPLIRETWDRIGVQEMLRAVLPKDIQRDNPLEEPAFIDAFDQWHMQTEGSTQGCLNLVDNLRPLRDEQSTHVNDQWDLLTNSLHTLDFRLQQFEALLHWARITWEHDPRVYAAIKSQEIDGEDRGPEQPDSDKVTRLPRPGPVETEVKKGRAS